MANYDEIQFSTQVPSGLRLCLWIVGVGTITLSCGGCIAGSILLIKRSVTTAPQDVLSIAQSITKIQIPEGYMPQTAMQMANVSLAVFRVNEDQERDPTLLLITFPVQVNAQALKQEMNERLQQIEPPRLKKLESQERTYQIRGKSQRVVIVKSEDETGSKFVQVTSAFESRAGGPAIMMLVMSEPEWNELGESTFEEIVRSMK